MVKGWSRDGLGVVYRWSIFREVSHQGLNCTPFPSFSDFFIFKLDFAYSFGEFKSWTAHAKWAVGIGGGGSCFTPSKYTLELFFYKLAGGSCCTPSKYRLELFLYKLAGGSCCTPSKYRLELFLYKLVQWPTITCVPFFSFFKKMIIVPHCKIKTVYLFSSCPIWRLICLTSRSMLPGVRRVLMRSEQIWLALPTSVCQISQIQLPITSVHLALISVLSIFHTVTHTHMYTHVHAHTQWPQSFSAKHMYTHTHSDLNPFLQGSDTFLLLGSTGPQTFTHIQLSFVIPPPC